MGERANEIDYKKIRMSDDLVKIKSIYTRNYITPITGSVLSEMFDDFPETFANGRFIIVDTKYNGRIGMINPKDTGIRIEYIDLFTGTKEKIAIGDIVDKMGFHQCMNIINGRGNAREIISDFGKKAGKGALNFAKGPGKEGAKKFGKVAVAQAKKAGKGTVDFLNLLGSTEDERN